MVHPSLPPAKRAILGLASRSRICDALNRLEQVASDGTWLAESNPYRTDAAKRIQTDKGVLPERKSAFEEYLAAAALVHCGDSWAYLGRAFGALAAGDVNSATHLVYYAELRAAMSILASEGVFVGDRTNWVVQADGTVSLLSTDGTHVAAWQILDAWTNSAPSGQLIGRIVRPGGHALSLWAETGLGATEPVIQDLLRRLALDLQTFSTDRQRRNSSTYNPTRMVPVASASQKVRETIVDTWSLLEPQAVGEFPVMDRALLECTLEAAYEGQRNSAETSGAAAEDDAEATGTADWPTWLERHTPGELVGGLLHEQLSDTATSNAYEILNRALTRPDDADAGEYLPGMATRAAVLARLATGSALDLIEVAGSSPADFTAWLDRVAITAGIWSDPVEPDDRAGAVDLWIDVDEACSRLANSAAGHHRALLDEIGSDLAVIGQAERVLAWSFS